MSPEVSLLTSIMLFCRISSSTSSTVDLPCGKTNWLSLFSWKSIARYKSGAKLQIFQTSDRFCSRLKQKISSENSYLKKVREKCCSLQMISRSWTAYARLREDSLRARWFNSSDIVSSRKPVCGSLSIAIIVLSSSGMTGFGLKTNDYLNFGSSY